MAASLRCPVLQATGQSPAGQGACWARGHGDRVGVGVQTGCKPSCCWQQDSVKGVYSGLSNQTLVNQAEVGSGSEGAEMQAKVFLREPKTEEEGRGSEEG